MPGKQACLQQAEQAVRLVSEEVLMPRHMTRADAQGINISTCTWDVVEKAECSTGTDKAGS